MDVQYRSRVINKGHVHLELKGSFSYPNALRVKDELHALINEERKNILVDLNSLDYIDSVGIGIIMGLQVRIRELRGRMYIICEKASIMKIIQLVGMDRAFDLYPRISEAEAELQLRTM